MLNPTIFTRTKNYSFMAYVVLDYDITANRKRNNADMAIRNDVCNQMLEKHYCQLYKDLVYTDEDSATFDDTFLHLTRVVESDVKDDEFIKKFKQVFKQKKNTYNRDYNMASFASYDSVYDCLTCLIDKEN
jgi:hypothetical protein